MVNSMAILLAGAVIAFGWPFSQTVTQTDTSEYPIGAHGTLSVENASGDIKVQAWDGSTVRVVAHRKAESQAVLANVRVQESSLNDNVMIKSVYPSHCVNCEIDYEIQVPRSTAVHAEDSSGNIQATGVNGPLDLTTASGNVEIRQAGGPVRVEAASGAVTVDGARGTVRVRTASGDVKLSGLNGDVVEAHASSGDVSARVENASALHSIKLDAASGTVTLTMPRGIGATISAQTDAGWIKSDFGQEPRTGYAGATLVQTIGDGRVKVDLSAVSGGVALRAL